MDITITNNRGNLDITDIFEIGKRENNPKRNFLFINKLLGKHLEVSPSVCKTTGWLLTAIAYGLPELIYSEAIKKSSFNENLFEKELVKDDALVIGFAETATGLGMAVASAIKGCVYQTTTREKVVGAEYLFSFEEEHSHATTHNCYTYNQPKLTDYKKIILVDDEITTGDSMLNIIKAIINISNVKEFKILTILDWRDKEHKDKYETFCKENNVRIEVISAMAGFILNTDTTVYTDRVEPMTANEKTDVVYDMTTLERISFKNPQGEDVSYFKDSGRFGVKHDDILKVEEECKKIAENLNQDLSKSDKVLVLGHGENIYIPSRIAAHLVSDTKFRTTSRSPICVDGNIIKDKTVFYDKENKYFFYNKCDAEKYDVVIIITETDMPIKLTNNCVTIKI